MILPVEHCRVFLSCLNFQYSMTRACLSSQAGLIIIPWAYPVHILLHAFPPQYGENSYFGVSSLIPSYKLDFQAWHKCQYLYEAVPAASSFSNYSHLWIIIIFPNRVMTPILVYRASRLVGVSQGRRELPKWQVYPRCLWPCSRGPAAMQNLFCYIPCSK